MRIIEEETARVSENIPIIQRLLDSRRISTSEKLRVLENPNIDLKCFLASIGESV